jgi:hypothetical protein
MATNNKHEVTKRTLRFLDTVKKLDPALASEADAVTIQLSACQAILNAERQEGH